MRGKFTSFLMHRALETVLTIPLDQLSPEPHLKLSGIAVSLAGVLEDNSKPAEAYEVYVDALNNLRKSSGTLSPKERLRAVAIAYKLGEMADTYQQPQEDEEKWLVYAVEEMLRVLRDEQRASVPKATPGSESMQPQQHVSLDELELPAWVDKTDIVAPIQALGEFYSRVGKEE